MLDEKRFPSEDTRKWLRPIFSFFLTALFLAVSGSKSFAVDNQKPIDFDREIRPLFSENCYSCHGPDENKRKAGLRLDRKDSAFKPLKDGSFAIVPGDLSHSQMVGRITSADPDEQMPPPASGKTLSKAQIELLQRWIGSGAKWEAHWSFTAAKKPAVPIVQDFTWAHNPIDQFILARLEKENLKPSPPANHEKLLRRLSLDLTGLPPTPAQLKDWSQRQDPINAAVAELLASSHYGERMASDWLDVARYADTHGFNNDSARSMWPWRDWVINAFNQNMRYDRFITEQIAGDLEKNAGLDQQVATGFNRNHGINSEGGIIDEEYRVSYVNDRVRTTSMAWMGLTMECARCHDHKFDPITQHDYYKFFAFFNNVDEYGEDGRIANASPLIKAPTDQQQKEIATLRHRIEIDRETMQKTLTKQRWDKVQYDALISKVPSTNIITTSNSLVSFDLKSWNASSKIIINLGGGKPFIIKGEVTSSTGPVKEPALVFDGKSDLKTDALPGHTGKGWVFSAWVRSDAVQHAPLFSTANLGVPESAAEYGRGVQILLTREGAIEVRSAQRWPAYSMNIVSREGLPLGEWEHVAVVCEGSTRASSFHIFLNGNECFSKIIHDDLTGAINIGGHAQIGGSGEKNIGKFIGALSDVHVSPNVGDLETLSAQWCQDSLTRDAMTALAARHADQDDRLHRAWLTAKDSQFAKNAKDEREALASLLKLEINAPDTMVMSERPEKRATHLLFRGAYDAPRDEVQPDAPEFLFPFAASAPHNRLGLAQWLTDPQNPLTARVVVNRFWQSIFGTGIVKTAGDFGYQGDYPEHPELLDWLATHFVESGWDVKELIKLMVTSATYAQTSDSSAELNERDPENRLLARGPRERLTAEMLRDQALAISGLLYDKIGGPSVYPYQPKNLYKGIVVAADYPGTSYTDSKGNDLYRRSIYTFWKRTVPYPTLSIFDVPDREVCVVTRSKTDTPLQALELMNDPVQLEAARKLAERMLREGGATSDQRLNFAFKLATARKPRAEELQPLNELLQLRLAVYRKDPAAAKAFISIGDSKSDPKIDPADLAAYANLASLILNLDETITRN